MRGLYLGEHEFVSFAEAQRRLGTGQTKGLSEHVATRDRSPDFVALGMYLPNPDPILKKMGKDVEVYRQLRGDAHTGGCIRRRKAAVKSLEWRIEKDKASSRMHKIVQAVFDRLDLDTLINELMDAVLYGYQPLEVIWSKGQGRAPLPDRIVGKPADWFIFDADAQLRFRSRENLMEGEALAPRKFLLAQQEATYANPYGFADLSMCFWPVTFKKGGLRYWVKFTEKYGMPWAVGKQPRNSPKAETANLLDQLEAMIEDAVAVIPDDASVEMLQATGASGSADAYERLLMFCRSEVAIALLGQNQSTEASSTHASASAGLDVAGEIRDGDKGLVESVLNKQLIRWIVDLHEGESAPAPIFELFEEQEISSKKEDRDKVRKENGVVFTRSYFLREYDLQESDIEDAPGPSSGPAATRAGGLFTGLLARGEQQPQFAEGDDPAADEVARLAQQLAPAGAQVVGEWMQRLKQLLAEATSTDDLQARILAAFDELPEAELVDVMGLGLAAARLAGMDAARAEAEAG
jgi:phage gp29-like protein